MSWLLRELSLPHWRRHAPRTFLTLLSVAAGVAAMVATATVAESVFASFERMVSATSGRADLQVTNGGVGVPEELTDELHALADVAHASAFVSGIVVLREDRERVLSVFGFDVLADDETLARVPRSAIHVPDRGAFVMNPDSVALPRSTAASLGRPLGSRLEVLAPGGPVTLIVRGIVDDVGPVRFLGEGVALMDVASAQALLGKTGRVDRIDLHTRAADGSPVPDAIADAARGRAHVHRVADESARARAILRSLRVVLTLAGAIALIVGFFIIFHATSLSVAERRADIGLLSALGVGTGTIIAWVLLEALVQGTLAGVVGVAAGVGLASLSLSLFGEVAGAWVATPPPTAAVPATTLAGTFAIGLVTILLATALAARALLLEPLPGVLTAARDGGGRSPGRAWGLLFGAGALALAGVGLWLAPRTLPYTPLVGFILGVNCLLLAGVGLVSPLPTLLIGRLALGIAERRRGPVALLAGAAIHRRPGSVTAVVAAIVMALGWSMANASLVESFKGSWLSWVGDHYRTDLIVSAGGRATDILTARAFSERVAAEIRALPGVTDVEALRRTGVDYEGRPTLLLATDATVTAYPVLEGSWAEIADTFRRGEGVLVGDTLAHRAALRRGQSVTLLAADGDVTLPILAIVRDVYGGDLGSIALSRSRYRDLWRDALIDNVRVWTHGPRDGVRAAINRAYATTLGVHASDFEEVQAALAQHIDDAFAINYALVVVCLAVSAVGIVNFLLSAILDRRREYETMHALGLAPGQIAGSVSVEGGIIGLTGVVVGVAAGALVSAVIVWHSVPMVTGWHFELTLPVGFVLTVGAAIVLAATGVGVFPGRAAARGSAPRGGAE